MPKVCRTMKKTKNPKTKKKQKQPLCWLICNHGNKIIHYKENGIQIALHCSDHCPWKYWTVSARFHNNIYNNSHSFPKYMRGLSRKMYILTNQVAYLCEMVWNTEIQCSGHITVWTKVRVNCLPECVLHNPKAIFSLKSFWQIMIRYLSSPKQL